MQPKEIIKIFIPPIFLKIRNHFFLAANKSRDFVSTITEIEKNDNTLVVIGNGPSLNASLEKYKDKIVLHECIVVNHFCETEYYAQLKPKYYLLADPAFFGKIDTYADWQREKIKRFIDSIVINTKWNIDLVVPSIAIGSEFINRVKENPLIHPYYYNSSDTCKYEENEKFKLWDKNLLSVPAQTCLNTCVWLGIFLRYKEVYIVGADTNWIELLHVDQETNVVYITDTHFYGQKKMILYKDSAGKIPITMAEQLSCDANAFRLYLELEDYAKYAGVKIYNASEYSLIDAFERRKIPLL